MNCIICGRFTVNEEVCIFCFVKYSDLTCKHIYNPNYCIYCGKQNPVNDVTIICKILLEKYHIDIISITWNVEKRRWEGIVSFL